MDEIKITQEQLDNLERLTNESGVSGDEHKVRQLVYELLPTDLYPSVCTDALGNLVVEKQGTIPGRLKVMIAAHMDEIGFMITGDEEKGIFKFDTVGGIDERTLVGKSVVVGDDKIPGVIGAKPIHLAKPDELKRAIPLDSLRIDVSPENASKVKVGDRAVFDTKFLVSRGSILAKAIDDRIGTATLIELLNKDYPNIDLVAAFTVQEEVGLRGARTAAYAIDPAVAIVLDSTPAMDIPDYHGEENYRYNTKLDHGPAIYIGDGATLGDPRLVKLLAQTAEDEGIPFQFRQPGRGGTDAGSIHKQREGIPSVSMSVPARYLHTAVSLVRIADWENSIRLMDAVLKKITPELLSEPR